MTLLLDAKMPKNAIDYHSSDEDSDDDEFFKGAKFKVNEGRKLYPVYAGNVAHFPIPSRVYHYDYIVNVWKKQLSMAGIGDERLKSFLSESSLLNGSSYADVESRWSQGHELWVGRMEQSSQMAVCFSSDSIEELVNMLDEQCPQALKQSLKPDRSKSLVTQTIFEAGTLRAERPIDVEALRSLISEATGSFFSFRLVQSRNAFSQVQQHGGSILTIRTQRWDNDASVIPEIGWAYMQSHLRADGTMGVETYVRHRVSEEYVGYRNTKVPDTRDVGSCLHGAAYVRGLTPSCFQHFGFPDEVTGEGTLLKEEAAIMAELGEVVNKLASAGPLIIVCHGVESELAYFGRFLSCEQWRSLPPTTMHQRGPDGKYLIVAEDSQTLYAAFVGNPQYGNIALHSACQEQRIACHKKNNAGNDSYYLLQLYFRMLESTRS